MKAKNIVLILLSIIALSCSNNTPNNDDAIEKIKLKMKSQEEAWNNGNLEEFMGSYWKSDSLSFIGKSGVNYGWQTTLDNYKNSYQSKAEMGKLSFNNITIKQLSKDYIYIIGKWHLKRSNDLKDLQGHYTLIWKNINDEWLIISDHSS